MMKLLEQLRLDDTKELLIDTLVAIAQVCQEISLLVRQGSLAGVLGSSTSENIQGETQKRLDIISNQLFKDVLLNCAAVSAVASEEEENSVIGNLHGKYLVAFDPLDGSSNIDINGQIGSIFSILETQSSVGIESPAQFFQPGSAQVSAGYVLYGPSTCLVLVSGNKTRLFTLDAITNEFILSNEHLTIAQSAEEFAINMSNQTYWSYAIQSYIGDLVKGKNGPRKKHFNMRWNGAMVGDVHRVLLRGGIFLYPLDNRTQQRKAKLRLLYEANPMALLIESAGGKAMTESERILDIIPMELHQRVSVILGAADEVDYCIAQIQTLAN